MSTPLVEARGIVKRYGPTTALADGQLTVLPGESHALVGRNGAGKSTLVNILTGLQPADEGEVRFDGEPAPALADRDAWRRKVACVYQKPTVVPELTVAENLFINRQPLQRGFISWRKLRTEAADLLATWDVHVDPEARTADLKVEDRQMVEIARALSFGARFIVLDEPTAQLDNREIERLFTRMRALQDSGVTFLFISHHLQEVYEVCQTVTVLRDARWITTAPVADLPRGALVEAMAGESVTEQAERQQTAPAAGEAPVLLDVRGLTSPSYTKIDLSVRRGEVVGLAGISGSGKIELAETMAGLHTPTAGTALIDGAPLPFGDVRAALDAGVGCVPRDRHGQGLVFGMTIGDNATMSVLDRLGRFGFVGSDRRRGLATELIDRLDIHAEGPDQPVSDLSGGNAQKVVMARALASDPRLLVLINPTAGVDVKSKESLLARVDSAREDGTAVLVVSDELDDLRRCDRVLVLFHGRVVAEHPAGWRDHELIASIEGVDHG
ncbi:sugar ABC transporter ATP-binding protein [Streptomyces spinoverrucosus]|uniref:Sugar ABC transporter ATP-binding protein n=1 Tax=Streptomyces spinoverrucosus TaxID=284043 RepID=A0A4Y3V9R2_9ACTN|nr:sugar ABC transporter ATP-binding protein [Streptomyces spinoverrucosus]GEC02828.1 sugar ABC transporter ATP-binding protein [Streptomyces spinoverrucosus]GHB40216.1 sugar ABC transporter ATP-binding protein [Streptomyces spinoverrucosus]